MGAYRNVDADAMRSLMTGAAKEEFESAMLPLLNGGLPEEFADILYDTLPEETADEIFQTMKEMMQPILKQMFGQVEIVSSEHVGDEFHFRIGIPVDLHEIPGVELPD